MEIVIKPPERYLLMRKTSATYGENEVAIILVDSYYLFNFLKTRKTTIWIQLWDYQTQTWIQ